MKSALTSEGQCIPTNSRTLAERVVVARGEQLTQEGDIQGMAGLHTAIAPDKHTAQSKIAKHI
jgi:hypothetical protein